MLIPLLVSYQDCRVLSLHCVYENKTFSLYNTLRGCYPEIGLLISALSSTMFCNMLESCDFQFLLGQQYDHSKRICGSYSQVYTVILVIVLTQQTTTTRKSAHDTSHLWCTTWPQFTGCTCKCTSSNMLTEIAVANNINNVLGLNLSWALKRIKMRST